MIQEANALRINLNTMCERLKEIAVSAKEQRKRQDLEEDPDKIFFMLINKSMLLELMLSKIFLGNDRVFFLSHAIDQLIKAVINAWPFIASLNIEAGEVLEKTYLVYLQSLQCKINKIDSEQSRSNSLRELVKMHPTDQFLVNLLNDAISQEGQKEHEEEEGLCDPILKQTTSTRLNRLPFYHINTQKFWEELYTTAEMIGFTFETTEPDMGVLTGLESYMMSIKDDLKALEEFVKKLDSKQVEIGLGFKNLTLIEALSGEDENLKERAKEYRNRELNKFLAGKNSRFFKKIALNKDKIDFDYLFISLNTTIKGFKPFVEKVEREKSLTESPISRKRPGIWWPIPSGPEKKAHDNAGVPAAKCPRV